MQRWTQTTRFELLLFQGSLLSCRVCVSTLRLHWLLILLELPHSCVSCIVWNMFSLSWIYLFVHTVGEDWATAQECDRLLHQLKSINLLIDCPILISWPNSNVLSLEKLFGECRPTLHQFVPNHVFGIISLFISSLPIFRRGLILCYVILIRNMVVLIMAVRYLGWLLKQLLCPSSYQQQVLIC